MNTGEKKLFIRRLFDEVWNAGKFELVDQFHTLDFVIEDPYFPVKTKGLETAKAYREFFNKAIPDLTLTIEEQIAEGDMVVTKMLATGTHKGEFLGLPPTFKKASVPCVVIHYFKGDKIAKAFNIFDALGFMRAVGAAEMPKEFAKEFAFAKS